MRSAGRDDWIVTGNLGAVLEARVCDGHPVQPGSTRSARMRLFGSRPDAHGAAAAERLRSARVLSLSSLRDTSSGRAAS